jgi:hypothetical protein
MPLPDARERLADMQAELVQTLVGQGRAPADFDAARLKAAAYALASKRARAVMQAWPALTHALGESFSERFAAYGLVSPLPLHGGPLADGRAFARYLAGSGELPDAGRMEALLVVLRFRFTAMGLLPRRGLALRFTHLKLSGRLVIGFRMPWLGGRYFSIPFGKRTGKAIRIR